MQYQKCEKFKYFGHYGTYGLLTVPTDCQTLSLALWFNSTLPKDAQLNCSASHFFWSWGDINQEYSLVKPTFYIALSLSLLPLVLYRE